MKAKLIATVITISTLTDVSYAAEQFKPQGIETFNGIEWSGLKLGETTFEEVKKKFKTYKGLSRNSISLALERKNPLRIDIFFDGSDKNSKIEGILLKYKDDKLGYSIDDLRNSIGDGLKAKFSVGRLEDWKIVLHPKKGILLFVCESRVPMLILGDPERTTSIVANMSTTPTPIVVRDDPNASKPRLMEFGRVDVQFDLNGLPIRRQDDVEDEYRASMKRATAGGTMRYEYGTAGSYNLTIATNYSPQKGGTGSVRAFISGPGPYGLVSGASYKSFNLPSVKDGGVSEATSFNFSTAVFAARREAEDNFKNNMLSQGPPPVSTFRITAWDNLVEAYRRIRPL